MKKKISNTITEKMKQYYPVQVTISREKARLCKVASLRLPVKPMRCDEGSFSHFANYWIHYGLLQDGHSESFLESIS